MSLFSGLQQVLAANDSLCARIGGATERVGSLGLCREPQGSTGSQDIFLCRDEGRQAKEKTCPGPLVTVLLLQGTALLVTSWA
jgi:hypothetical protein